MKGTCSLGMPLTPYPASSPCLLEILELKFLESLVILEFNRHDSLFKETLEILESLFKESLEILELKRHDSLFKETVILRACGVTSSYWKASVCEANMISYNSGKTISYAKF